MTEKISSKQLLFKFNYENGWGDTFLSIFDIVNCANYIKNNHPDIKLILYINDKYVSKNLQLVLNMGFFNSLFDEFKILEKHELFTYGSNETTYNDIKYLRLFSGRNEEFRDHTPGIFDVYTDINNYEYFKEINIPFIEFRFDNHDDRPKDFEVFNQDIVDNVNKFINENLSDGFESIYYRSTPPIDKERIIKFKNKLTNELDYDKKYFLCSNSSFVKHIFLDSTLKISLYRPIEKHDINHIPNGFVRYGVSGEDALFAVAELIILSKGNVTHYCGDMSWVSLFNWYSINIKKVKLNEIII